MLFRVADKSVSSKPVAVERPSEPAFLKARVDGLLKEMLRTTEGQHHTGQTGAARQETAA